MQEPPVVVRPEPAPPQPWEHAAGEVHTAVLSQSSPEEARSALARAGCALLDGTTGHPVETARRVHALDPALQVAVVTPPEGRAAIQRAMLFAPGLGEIWLVAPEEVGPALVARASAVTRQRRSYRATHLRIEHALSSIETHAARRAFVSDAFLAALLDVLPDPVIAVDDAGRVLTWNPAAERTLGYTRDEARGRTLVEVLSPENPEVRARLADAPDEGATLEIGFRARDGARGIGEITMVPVEAAGHRVRAVVLHDVTEERRARAESEAHATEVEKQAEELQSQATQLEEVQLELEMSNEELQKAITALAQRSAEAELARKEAEAANRAKSDFLATMSHEIRTPINAIIGYTDLLEMGIAGPLTDAQREQLERVRASSRHLLMLIEDVLDLAKVEAGRMHVERKRVLARSTIEAALAIVGPQAAENHVRLEISCAGSAEASYLGDEDRVRQILVNLLSNAVKFTPAGGEIHVACDTLPRAHEDVGLHGGPWCCIRVQDTGIGIEPGKIETVFRPFVQVETGLTRTRGGTGLGLSISRQLARLMGGELTAASEPGAGSTFTLWLASGEAAP